MSSGFSGILLAYRWPFSCQQNELPQVCHELSILPFENIKAKDRFLIHHGNECSRVENPWSPEHGTACAILRLRDLPPHTVDALDTAFAGEALTTRFQSDSLHHVSAVAWLPEHEAITLHGDVPKMTDILDAGHSRVIYALRKCVRSLDGNFSKRARSRWSADVEACDRAVNALHALELCVWCYIRLLRKWWRRSAKGGHYVLERPIFVRLSDRNVAASRKARGKAHDVNQQLSRVTTLKSLCTGTVTSSSQCCHPVGASIRPFGLFATRR